STGSKSVCPRGRPSAYLGIRWAACWSTPRPHPSGHRQTATTDPRLLVGGMASCSYGHKFIQCTIIYVSPYVGHPQLAEHQLVIRHLFKVCIVYLLCEFEIDHDGFVITYQNLVRPQGTPVG